MMLSLLFMVPALGLLILSIFLSYNKMKILFFSLLPAFVFVLVFFIFDRFLFSESFLLIGLGKASYTVIHPLFGQSAKSDTALYITSGIILILVFFSIVFFTSRILVGRFLSQADPAVRSVRRTIRHSLFSIGFFLMGSFLLLYFLSGLRPSVFISSGFLEPVFNLFVPFEEASV